MHFLFRLMDTSSAGGKAGRLSQAEAAAELAKLKRILREKELSEIGDRRLPNSRECS
jgi:hypothetical protein